MISRLELKTKAKESLRGRWVLAIGVTLIYMAISGIVSVIPYNIGTIIMIFCAPAFSLGLMTFFLKLSRNEDVEIEMLFSGFSQFIKAFCVSFMMGLIIFLWSLLLIIPGVILVYQYYLGYYTYSVNFMPVLFVILLSIVLSIPAIIATYRYSMVYYILSDNPDMGVMEILKESKRLTQGYKGAIFVLQLSFIGWALLSILTCFIGFIWLEPYVSTTMANMYNKLKEIKDGNYNSNYENLNNDNFNNNFNDNNFNNDNLNSDNFNNVNLDNDNFNNDNLNFNNDNLNSDNFNNDNLNNDYFNNDNNSIDDN